MRFFSLLALLWALLSPTMLRAQACTGDMHLTTQPEVDAFACTSLEGSLTITGDDITNLDGLASLESVGGDLSIRRNASLTNVDGLASLTSVKWVLLISENTALTSVDGLASLTSVKGALHIRGNAALTNCAVGLGRLLMLDADDDSVVGSEDIWGNSPNGHCNSVPSVLDAFRLVTSVDDNGDLHVAEALSVTPNPAYAAARLSFALEGPASVTVALYDLLGRQVAMLADGSMSGSVEMPLDTSSLAPGVYLARLVAGERVETVRVLVVR
jgi:hypothetical protein